MARGVRRRGEQITRKRKTRILGERYTRKRPLWSFQKLKEME